MTDVTWEALIGAAKEQLNSRPNRLAFILSLSMKQLF